MRTTLDIDDPILKELRKLQRREGKSLGKLVSELLAQSLSATRTGGDKPAQFTWIVKPMGARVDIADKYAVLDAMDVRTR